MEHIKTEIIIIGAPHLSISPSEITIEEGDFETLEWKFFDSFPTTYLVSDNDNAYDNGLWNSGELLKVNLESLTLGTHDIVVKVQNANSFSTSDTVNTSNLPILFITLAVVFLAYTRKTRK